MKSKKQGGIESIKRRYGALFIAPWVFGVVLFVIVPVFTFFWYSLSDIEITASGIETTFAGLKHYKYISLSIRIMPICSVLLSQV